MTKVRSVARRRRPLVGDAGLVLFVYMGVVHRKGQCAKSDKTQKNDCKGRLYSMSEELSRSFQFPVKSLVRRENARCSYPREEQHLRCLTGSLKGYACAHVLPQCRGALLVLAGGKSLGSSLH